MNTEEKLISLITEKTATILTTNEYATGKNFETNIGNSIKSWSGKDIDEENESERIEIRDVEGVPLEDEDPIDKEVLTIEFAVYKKMALKDMVTEDDVAVYLRKVKSDIYRMIGSNINYFRSGLSNYSLKFTRGKWEKNIDTAGYVYGEMMVGINIQYTFEDAWLLNEPIYS